MKYENKKKPAAQAVKYTANEIAKVDDLKLNEGQVKLLLKKTPARHIKTREAYKDKQGKPVMLSYVKGVYIKKVLNFMFGWEWSFEVVENKFDLELKEAYVLGRLTVPLNDGSKVVKMQFGGASIKFNKGGKPLSIGNDLKAAATDALKKCASELGIASDVYQPEEFQEIDIVPEKPITLEVLTELFEKHGHHLHHEDQLNVERVIDTKETSSYKKMIKELSKYEDE